MKEKASKSTITIQDPWLSINQYHCRLTNTVMCKWLLLWSFKKITHTHTQTFTLQNKSNLLHYFKISSDITLLSLCVIMVSFIQPKLHNVNTNPKLWLQGNVGIKCSPVNFGENPNIETKYILICMGFWLGQQKWT